LSERSRCPSANSGYCWPSSTTSVGFRKGFTVTENHGVGGSIPPLGTTKINNLERHPHFIVYALTTLGTTIAGFERTAHISPLGDVDTVVLGFRSSTHCGDAEFVAPQEHLIELLRAHFVGSTWIGESRHCRRKRHSVKRADAASRRSPVRIPSPPHRHFRVARNRLRLL
jgi:hypothetical protein